MTNRSNEIHHRVKNNLQIIASILRLQARREDSPAAQSALSDAIQRIMSMVQVHDLLSHTEKPEVELNELLDRLLSSNIQSLMMPGQTVLHEVHGESITLNADRAINIALVTNELIVNSLKHAFAGRHQGRIDVRIERNQTLTVSVEDDGVGLPEDFTLTGYSNLGFRLVQSIVKDDLKGTFEITANGGTRAVLRVPSASTSQDF